MIRRIREHITDEIRHHGFVVKNNPEYYTSRLREFVNKNLKKLISIPLMIGLVASILMYYTFGLLELEKTLLSWTIGITSVTAIIAFIESVFRF